MVKITKTFVENLAFATSRNDHNSARIDLARKLNSPTLKKYQKIMRDHMVRGHLTREDYDKRSALDKKLFSEAKKKLSKSDYDLVESAF